MGQKMPDEPIEYGRDCGVQFPANETPKYLYARFINVVLCPVGTVYPPNDIVFKCEQHAVDNCVWEHTVNNFHMIIDLKNDPPNAILWLELLPTGHVYFWDSNVRPIIEGRVYHNNLLDCDFGEKAAGGVCVITWTPQATALLEDINMVKGTDLFMEVFPIDTGELVYKFCRIAESTNIKILLEPT